MLIFLFYTPSKHNEIRAFWGVPNRNIDQKRANLLFSIIFKILSIISSFEEQLNLYYLTKPSQMRKSLLLVIITTQDKQNAELLNIFFFSDSVKNIKIPTFSKTSPLAEILSDPTLKAILKYKNHRSIVAIRNANNNSFFYFYEVSIEEVYEEI